MTQSVTPATAGEIVLHPDDPVARVGARIIIGLAVVLVAAALAEFIALGSPVLGVVCAVLAAAAAGLAVVVITGSRHLLVAVEKDAVVVGHRRLPRESVVALRRHSYRTRGIDLIDADGAVLYAMPAWFNDEQESAFLAAMGLALEEAPEPIDEAEEEGDPDGAPPQAEAETTLSPTP